MEIEFDFNPKLVSQIIMELNYPDAIHTHTRTRTTFGKEFLFILEQNTIFEYLRELVSNFLFRGQHFFAHSPNTGKVKGNFELVTFGTHSGLFVDLCGILLIPFKQYGYMTECNSVLLEWTIDRWISCVVVCCTSPTYPRKCYHLEMICYQDPIRDCIDSYAHKQLQIPILITFAAYNISNNIKLKHICSA